jgi:hypothetical protein
MSQSYRCDRCKKDIISKLPDDDEMCTIRPYGLEFDRFPGPNDACMLFRYASLKFDLCIDCKDKFLNFMKEN